MLFSGGCVCDKLRTWASGKTVVVASGYVQDEVSFMYVWSRLTSLSHWAFAWSTGLVLGLLISLGGALSLSSTSI